MRVTRRGWGVVAVVGFCLVMAWKFGPRSLNAIVVPLVVALVAGAITVTRANEPRVSRAAIEEGFVGERRAVSLEADVDRPIAAELADDVGRGLSATGNVAETTLAPERGYSYELELECRGKHEVGPLSLSVTDAFGLVERQFEIDRTTRVVVYPPVYDLRGGSGDDFALLTGAIQESRRDEFDHLREYEHGDSLRNVHWKSAAKRPDDDLVVKEFTAHEDDGTVTVAAESVPETTDEMAAATASVVTYALESAVPVDVVVPDGSASATARHDRRDVLRLLATAGPGTLAAETRREADVLIRADEGGTTVTIDGLEVPFERLAGATIDGGADPRRGVIT
ncbi:DUF58 domain-containing protein [Natribaculum luteum]|uniref:DUF58 domain-containing protein n=1 Tax=Natribaculum luteum TaxID=1586232 RepID=A0ABD5P2Y0_9EURY|nr:DUF58 domain-containing protein [Natribaculum luteum]